MAVRSIWSGSITFGLVNVPIRMYSAIDEKDLRFNLLHVTDGSRIGYEKICKEEGEPVPDGGDGLLEAVEPGGDGGDVIVRQRGVLAERDTGIVAGEHQPHDGSVDRLLARMFEIHGHLAPGHGLNLAQPPRGFGRVTHQDARLQERIPKRLHGRVY